MLDFADPPVSTDATDYQTHRRTIEQAYGLLDSTIQSQRARHIAAHLGITEAQWVAANCGPISSLRLHGKGESIFKQLGGLGDVMALTRNASCVHERHGTYSNIQVDGPVGVVLGPDIDLRVFLRHWQDVFAVTEAGRHSLQFFDETGAAVHKVYCTAHTDMAYYSELMQTNVQPHHWPAAKHIVQDKRPEQTVDAQAVRQAWLAMSDTHDFFPLLKRLNISRLGALASAGEDLAQPVSNTGVESMLRHVAASGLAIMCFVSNRGMIQIHTGPVRRIVKYGAWLNVLDPAFNLHLNMDDVASTWVVNKPTTDGWVTSLEIFDEQGELITQFFGARKPGTPELSEWRHLMQSICQTPLRQ